MGSRVLNESRSDRYISIQESTQDLIRMSLLRNLHSMHDVTRETELRLAYFFSFSLFFVKCLDVTDHHLVSECASYVLWEFLRLQTKIWGRRCFGNLRVRRQIKDDDMGWKKYVHPSLKVSFSDRCSFLCTHTYCLDLLLKRNNVSVGAPVPTEWASKIGHSQSLQLHSNWSCQFVQFDGPRATSSSIALTSCGCAHGSN